MDHSEGGDDDNLDIDTHGSCCQAWKLVRVSPGLQRAIGPVRQAHMYLWPKFYLDVFDREGILDRFLDNLNMSVGLRTNYSGMGCAEQACRLIVDNMKLAGIHRRIGCKPCFHYLMACDMFTCVSPCAS